jgi:3-oxoacyl-[acyl-carrier-protein] synthase-3
MGIGISAVSFHLPEGRLTHEELSERYGADQMKRVADLTGIRERRVVTNDECASDLAFKAAEDLIARHNIDRSTIDLVTFATQTPDYLLPTTACILQDRLKLPKTTAAFDINLGCSQYLYSLGVAHGMISGGTAKRALVLTGDTVSRIIHPMDRAVVPLFGDAGTATIVEMREGSRGFLGFDFGTDGSGHQALIWPTSGLRKPRTPETAVEHTDKSGATRTQNDMFMDGPAIYVFTLRTVAETVKRVLAKTSLTVNDIDLFIFHQASKMIVESAARMLKLPSEKVHMRLSDVGNSGGSTVAIALSDALEKGRLKPGMKVVLSAFGVGLSWGSTVLEWS